MDENPQPRQNVKNFDSEMYPLNISQNGSFSLPLILSLERMERVVKLSILLDYSFHQIFQCLEHAFSVY
jgi:hypothetical protein